MGNFFLINAHGVLRRMGAVTEIPGTTSETHILILESLCMKIKHFSLKLFHLCCLIWNTQHKHVFKYMINAKDYINVLITVISLLVSLKIYFDCTNRSPNSHIV